MVKLTAPVGKMRTPANEPLEDEDVQRMRKRALELQKILVSGKGKYRVGEAEGELLEMVLALAALQDQQQQARGKDRQAPQRCARSITAFVSVHYHHHDRFSVRGCNTMSHEAGYDRALLDDAPQITAQQRQVSNKRSYHYSRTTG